MTTHRLNFFPLGNADCCRIDLDNGDQILIDYAAMRDPECKDDLRIDLPAELQKYSRFTQAGIITASSHLHTLMMTIFGALPTFSTLNTHRSTRRK